MKSFFYYSRKERWAISIIALLLVAIVACQWLYRSWQFREQNNVVSDIDTAEVNQFLTTVQDDRIQKSSPGDSVFQPRVFDPNKCDSMTLIHLGLKHWQVKIFLKYRRAGARFYRREDLAKVYSFTEEDVERMMPYANFPIDERELKRVEREQARELRDSTYEAIRALYPEKMKQGETVLINASDTATLKKIPGIGSYYAFKIKQYGERLGGYVSLAQLDEIQGLPKDIKDWFQLDKVKINRLAVNKQEFKTLVRHPYLTYEQVKCIFNHRNKYGNITSLKQLSTEPAFTPEDLERLEPYLSFE